MTNTETKKPTSRRDWFTGSAALLGAGAISSILARAQSTGTGSTTNDINILNFALRLENLESAFYSQGLATFAPKDFQNSAAVQRLGGTKIGANIYPYLTRDRTARAGSRHQADPDHHRHGRHSAADRLL